MGQRFHMAEISGQRNKTTFKMASLASTCSWFIFFQQWFYFGLSFNNSISRNPNIIIFMTDNLSIEELSIYGNSSLQTPNIDRLVEEGVTFSRWYSQSSRISSLASILTGLLPPRTGIIKSKFLSFQEFPSLASTGGLQPNEITLAKVLKSKGYSTSFVGLWGLGVGRNGEYLPVSHGFDSWYGIPSAHTQHCTENHQTRSESQNIWEAICSFFSSLCYIFPVVGFVVWYNGYAINMATVLTFVVAFIFYNSILHDAMQYTIEFIQIRSCVLFKNNNIIEQPYIVENMTLRFTRSAVSFLETTSYSRQPFFLFVSFMNLNHPVFASRFFANSTQSAYHDALIEMDWSIGRIKRTLRYHNMDNNTLILFTSSTGRHVAESCDSCIANQDDNSEAKFIRGNSRNGIWEQTIRVPAVLTWRGQISDKQLIKTPVTVMDVMPTVLELMNYSTNELHFDGKNLLPVLFSTSQASQHEHIFHYVEVTKPAAITAGSYKVVYTDMTDDGTVEYFDPPLLFNVEADPEEKSPLPNDEHSELLANISKALAQHMKTRNNKWHSQLDSRIIPSWFPCAHYLGCSKTSDESSNFSDLFN